MNTKESRAGGGGVASNNPSRQSSFSNNVEINSIKESGDTVSRRSSTENPMERETVDIFLRFKTSKEAANYLLYLRSNYKFSVPQFVMIACILLVLIIRYSLDSSLRYGRIFIAAAVINAITGLYVMIFIIAQIEQFFAYRCQLCTRFLTFSPIHAEDLIIMMIGASSSMNTLFLTYNSIQATIGLDATIIGSETETIIQSSVRAAQYVPMEQVVVTFLNSFILPIAFGAPSKTGIIVTWSIGLGFLIAVETLVFGKKHLPYLAVVSHAFLLASLYEIEKNKMIIYFTYRTADLTASVSKGNEQKERVMRKREEIERKLNEALLHAMVPKKVAEKLKAGRKVMPEEFSEVTIFFSDVEGFTNICAQVNPIQVVNMLNELYTVMDYCTSLFPLYKVETIGDAYMLVGGLPEKDPKHAQAIANFALTVCTAVGEVKSPLDGTPLRIRMGIHSGPVMAGVVGNLMPRYCLFGDTVNTASRMESNGEAGRIHCSQATADILTKQGQHVVESRGEIAIKGKGIMHTYWVTKAGDKNRLAGTRQIQNVVNTVRELLEEAKENRLTDEPENSPAHLHDRRSSAQQMNEGYLKMYQNLTRNNSVNIPSTAPKALQNAPHPPSLAAPRAGSNNPSVADLHATSTISVTNKGQLVSHAPPSTLDHLSQLFRRPIHKHTSLSVVHDVGESRVASIADKSSKDDGGGRKSMNGSVRSGKDQQMFAKRHSLEPLADAIGAALGGIAAAEGDSKERENKGESRPSSPRTVQPRILVVMNSAMQRKMLVRLLVNLDETWQINEAVDSEQALVKLKAVRGNYNVIIVDESVGSDSLRGHEFIQFIRNVMNVTAYIIGVASEGSANKKLLLNAGADALWGRPPPPPDEIRALINQHLRVNPKGNGKGRGFSVH